MKSAIEQAKQKKRRIRRRNRCCAGMAAAFALICLIPNCSKASAQVLMELPLFGKFFEVITIRDYKFDNGNSSADVKIPELLEIEEGSSALSDVNRSIEEYTNEILERFEENQKILGNQGHQSLNISYEVLTNTKRWFTLELTVTEVQGSGFEYKQYYHIDKSTGNIAMLKDLFMPGSDYEQRINRYIKGQMKKFNKENKDGDVYWIGKTEFAEGFQGIDEEQGFYLDKDGSLVVVFDEYEVAPGYMGMPKFEIPQGLIQDIRKF